jgi:hypothetical protein
MKKLNELSQKHKKNISIGNNISFVNNNNKMLLDGNNKEKKTHKK